MLEELLGQSGELVTADWKQGRDERNRVVIELTLTDFTGSVATRFAASELKGTDSLYAIAQMPPGVPVACMAVGSWGARNAAVMAAQLLALKYDRIRAAHDAYRQRLGQS